MTRPFFLLCCVLASSIATIWGQEADVTPLKNWVANQQKLESLQAEFTQVRKLRTLKKPLESDGTFWFQAPDQFRWEIGDPARTIAVHDGDELTVIDTAKEKAEVVDTGNDLEDSRSRLSAFFDLSVPQTWDAFQEMLNVDSVERDGSSWVAHLTPKDRKQIRGVRSLAFRLDDKATQLLAFTLVFRDGSTLQTAFRNVQRDADIESGKFSVSLDGLEVKRRQ